MDNSVSQGDGLIWDGFTMPDSDFFKMPNDFRVIVKPCRTPLSVNLLIS